MTDTLWLASISGRDLLLSEMTSPLTIIVIIIVLVPVLAYYAIATRGGSERARTRARLGLITAGAVLLILVMVNYYTLQPSQTYGLELSHTKLILHYYEDRSEEYNLCNATIRLVSLEEAKSMLHVRTYGTADPLSGLAAGEFRLNDDRQAHVLIAPGATKALLIEEKEKPVGILAIPGVEEAYTAILQATDQCPK